MILLTSVGVKHEYLRVLNHDSEAVSQRKSRSFLTTKHWTYAQLETKSLAAANWLSQQGVEVGDRIAIMLPNAFSFPVWYYAALRIGAIAVSVSTRLAASEVAFVVEDCGATAFVASDSAMASVEAELPKVATVRLSVNDARRTSRCFSIAGTTPDDRIADLSSRSRRSRIDPVHLRHDRVSRKARRFRTAMFARTSTPSIIFAT